MNTHTRATMLALITCAAASVLMLADHSGPVAGHAVRPGAQDHGAAVTVILPDATRVDTVTVTEPPVTLTETTTARETDTRWTTGPTVTVTALPSGLVPCQEEDASTPGQEFPCRWDDGSGDPFTAWNPATFDYS